MSGPRNLIPFYRGSEANIARVTLNQILSWNDARLENVHNYIQWLFPQSTPSQYNPDAPLLDDATIQAFHNDPALQNNLLASFRRMLAFYGLQMDEGTRVITRAPNFNQRSSVWLTPGNHNFWRITRIIDSMKLLGFPGCSRAFLTILQDIVRIEGVGIVSDETLGHWRRVSPRAL